MMNTGVFYYSYLFYRNIDIVSSYIVSDSENSENPVVIIFLVVAVFYR